MSWRGIGAGLRYVAGRPELVGTYLIDVAATVVTIPTALYVFLADDLHAPWALGLLCTAPAGGALVAGAHKRLDQPGGFSTQTPSVLAALGADPAAGPVTALPAW